MLRKIHFHSECQFFGGCENLLPVLFNSMRIRGSFGLTFSYIGYQQYTRGLNNLRFRPLPIYILKSVNLYQTGAESKGRLGKFFKIVLFAARCLLHYPLFIYQIAAIYVLLNRIKPDILHINNGGYPAARSATAAAIAGKLLGVEKILMVVNNMATPYWHFTRWLDFPIDFIVKRCVDLFVTGSIAAKDSLRNVLGLPENKVISIHNGIDFDFEKSNGLELRAKWGVNGFSGVTFGIVGLLVQRKGHIFALQATRDLLQQNPSLDQEVKIVIIGTGPLEQNLKNYVKENHLGSVVKFVGHESNAAEFMKSIDVLLFPSVAYEDFPYVILEAMAAGKPVIASHIAGTPEQVEDGHTGFIIAPGCRVEIAKAIKMMCQNNDLRWKMGKAGLDRFNRMFRSEIAVEKYFQLYNKLVSNNAI